MSIANASTCSVTALREMIPRSYRGDVTPRSYRCNVTPRSYRGDVTPRSYRGDVTPRSNRGDVTSRSYRGDETPMSYRGDLILGHTGRGPTACTTVASHDREVMRRSLLRFRSAGRRASRRRASPTSRDATASCGGASTTSTASCRSRRRSWRRAERRRTDCVRRSGSRRGPGSTPRRVARGRGTGKGERDGGRFLRARRVPRFASKAKKNRELSTAIEFSFGYVISENGLLEI